MLKKVMCVRGIEILNKKAQKNISGGNRLEEGFGEPCIDSHDCQQSNIIPSICCFGICVYTTNWQNVC